MNADANHHFRTMCSAYAGPVAAPALHVARDTYSSQWGENSSSFAPAWKIASWRATLAKWHAARIACIHHNRAAKSCSHAVKNLIVVGRRAAPRFANIECTNIPSIMRFLSCSRHSKKGHQGTVRRRQQVQWTQHIAVCATMQRCQWPVQSTHMVGSSPQPHRVGLVQVLQMGSIYSRLQNLMHTAAWLGDLTTFVEPEQRSSEYIFVHSRSLPFH
jgi:hypothetical protein